MNLFDRIKTTVQADAHGVIDALEDRALILRQCLRDAEGELARKRAQLSALELDLRALQRDTARVDQSIAAADSDVALALGAGDDELARYALKRLLGLRARARRLAERAPELHEARRELEARLSEQLERHEELRARVAAELEHGPGEGATEAITEQQVELELLRRKAASRKEARP
jgi:phage shock protein A